MVVRGDVREVNYLRCWGWACRSEGVTVEIPVADGGSGPINMEVVKLEPWDSQNDRAQRGGDNVQF